MTETLNTNENGNCANRVLPAVAYELYVSQIYIKTPYLITDKRYEKFILELKKKHVYGDLITCIEDITPWGDFIGNSKNGKEQTRQLKLEIDNRYLSNDKACELLAAVFCNCR